MNNVVKKLPTSLYHHVGGASDLHKNATFLISYIICIIKTNYHCVRKDRSRHGGGIAVYIKSSLSFKVIPSPLNHDLILLSISISNYSLMLGSFYWPPNDNGSLDILINFLTSLSHDHMKNFFLTGDFIINFMSPSPLFTKLLEFTNSTSNLSCLSFVFPYCLLQIIICYCSLSL